MELTIAALELEILIDFLDEALEHLEGIEEKILQLENSQDIELVNSIFRPAHTIKGTASFLGLNDIKYLSHEMETMLDDLRNDRIGVSDELIDTLLEGVDTLATMLVAVQEGIKNCDQSKDPVLIIIAQVKFKEIIDAINAIKENHEPKETDKIEKKSKDNSPAFLTHEELKKISYPMEMNIAFEQESREHLNTLEHALLELEDTPEKFELYNDIFRDMHSLKGGAGVLVSTVEPQEIRVRHPITVFQDLAHAAEGLVQQARDSQSVLPATAVETLLTIIDRLKYILDGFINHDSSPAKADDLIALCQEYSHDKRTAGSKVDDKEVDDKKVDDKKERVNKNMAFALSNTLSQSLSAIKAGLDEIKNADKRQSALGKIIRSVNMIIKINQKSEIADLAKSADAILNTAVFLGKEKEVTEDEDDLIIGMQDAFKVLEKAVLDKMETDTGPAQEPVKPSAVLEKSDTQKEKAVSAQPVAQQATSIIKVPQERLDILMNLVGELIVSKNNFPALAKEITIDHNLINLGKKVKSAGDHVGRITDELQNIVMKMRMLPVGTVFSKFKRLVRDLAKKLDKKIVLKLSGEETELDKTIIETLGDPMVHLIRNCADHALEGVEERKEQGKSPEGTIHLKAYNQGQNVIIEIIDDGRGIDPNNIRAKAVEKGYLSLEELEKFDDIAIQNLIFRPGFSGAKQITDVSGRGVGMDVVKTNVEKIGGTVSLYSQKGIGTTFTITLPLTLAISKGLEVKADKQHYYLPLDYIVETVKISPDLVRNHKDMQMAVIRGSLLPVFSLATLLDGSKNIDRNHIETDSRTNIELSMVVLNMNGKKAALEVDRFYTENEYVVKPLSGALSKISGYTGATITSSGKVILILDPLKLF